MMKDCFMFYNIKLFRDCFMPLDLLIASVKNAFASTSLQIRIDMSALPRGVPLWKLCLKACHPLNYNIYKQMFWVYSFKSMTGVLHVKHGEFT